LTRIDACRSLSRHVHQALTDGRRGPLRLGRTIDRGGLLPAWAVGPGAAGDREPADVVPGFAAFRTVTNELTHDTPSRWPIYQDRFLDEAVAALWRRRRAIARRGLDIHFGGGAEGEWLEVSAPKRSTRAVILDLRPGNRGALYVERLRRRRNRILLRLEGLWFMNTPTRLVDAFEQSTELVASDQVWNLVERDILASWENVTLRPM
jgi:hypothetical protein